MWKLTLLGKLLVIGISLLPFFIILKITGMEPKATFILFLLCSIAVISIGSLVIQNIASFKHQRDMDRMMRRHINQAVKIKRVISKEDPYGEEDWEH